MIRKTTLTILALAFLAAVTVIGLAFLRAATTINDLLNESKQLRKAIANLTEEHRIGYARVLSQETRDGRLFTKLLFVEIDPEHPDQRSIDKECEIEGDVAHFDALIVRFSNDYVSDGRARALHLWQRIYGENMAPKDGFRIETPGSEPDRYKGIFADVPAHDRQLFWQEMWKLADDPDRLAKLGVRAIYGNVVYRKVSPGFIYVFTITNMGQVTIEPVPALDGR